MKKIVPFTRDLMFKTKIGEITSIALDNTLNLEDNTVSGEFIISGTYKMLGGQVEEEFKYNLPVDITIDTKYETKNCIVSIDDFSYEIINEEKLKVNISVMLDDLDIKIDPIETIEIEVKEESEKKEEMRNDQEFTMVDDDLESLVEEIANVNEKDLPIETTNLKPNIIKETNNQNINNTINNNTITNFSEDLLKNINDAKEYSIYRVYTMKEDDTLELIYEKFNVNKEILADYNDLDKLNVGSKLIIPSIDE